MPRHRRASLDHDSSMDDKVVQQWQQQYPLPDDSAEGSRPDVKLLYRYIGVVACFLMRDGVQHHCAWSQQPDINLEAVVGSDWQIHHSYCSAYVII